MPLPQDTSYQDMMGGIDRITSILQERAQPRAYSPMQGNASSVPLNIQQALLAQSMLSEGNRNYMQNLQNYETNMQNAELKNQEQLLNAYKMKLQAGDAQTKELENKIKMFVGDDAQSQALILNELHNLPEPIDPSNSNTYIKIAGIAKKHGLTNLDKQLERAKTQADIDYKRAMINRVGSSGISSGGASQPNFGKPPSGYRFRDDGSLEPIPGGPGEKISAELSARLGLGMKFLEEAPALKEEIKKGVATGALDYATGALGYGESGALQRRIADGADALQRMLTGAGMPASEAADYSNRFRATIKDTDSTLLDKVNNLETILKAQVQMASRGHGDILGGLPSNTSAEQQGKVIGTYQGKKVYELPDGSHAMEE